MEVGRDNHQEGAGAEPEPHTPRQRDPEVDRNTLWLSVQVRGFQGG